MKTPSEIGRHWQRHYMAHPEDHVEECVAMAIRERDAEHAAEAACVLCPDQDDNDNARGYCAIHGTEMRDRLDDAIAIAKRNNDIGLRNTSALIISRQDRQARDAELSAQLDSLRAALAASSSREITGKLDAIEALLAAPLSAAPRRCRLHGDCDAVDAQYAGTNKAVGHPPMSAASSTPHTEPPTVLSSCRKLACDQSMHCTAARKCLATR